ncbi:MAG: hypothetical protein HY553_11515 [Elusimicrobia bacterium]|nr:hypothetical protein [Elusimicrobiota bacterium]
MKNRFWIALASLALGAFAEAREALAPRAQVEFELGVVRHELRKKSSGPRWSAGITSMAQLSLDARRARLGGGGGAPSGTLPKLSALSVPGAGASAVDWRDRDGRDFVTPVKNQGKCASCWAFSTTAALESYILRRSSVSSQIDLSEQIVVSCSGAGNCVEGGFQDYAAEYLQRIGTADESLAPYQAADAPCTLLGGSWTNETLRAGQWFSVDGSVDGLRSALADHGPVVVWFRVYADFFFYQSGVYEHVAGDWMGNHSVVLVGYDDTQRAFIAKNSWGTRWGDRGYFLISYSAVSSEVELGRWSLAFAPKEPSPVQVRVAQPRPNAIVAPDAAATGSVTFEGDENFRVTALEFTVDGRRLPPVEPAQAWSVALSTESLADGPHTLTVTAADNAGHTRTVSVPFTVGETLVDDFDFRHPGPDTDLEDRRRRFRRRPFTLRP